MSPVVSEKIDGEMKRGHDGKKRRWQRRGTETPSSESTLPSTSRDRIAGAGVGGQSAILNCR